MLRNSLLLFLIYLISACQGPPRGIPFPSQEEEFPEPVSSSIKIPEAMQAHWSPSTRQLLSPIKMKTVDIPSKDSVFSLEDLHAMTVPLDSHIVKLSQMHSVPLSLKKLPKQKIHPSIILIGQPEKIKAALPKVEDQFTKGFLELGQDQGLPGTEVHSIQKDKAGRLWLSTDNGLCFFDGENIYALNKKTGLSRNEKNNICVDKNGHIWAAGNGVDEIIPEQNIIRHYGKKEGLFTDRIIAVDIDSTGVLYFSEKDGIEIYDPAEQTSIHIGKEEGLSIAVNINRITADKKGRIWIASNCAGVNIYDPATERLYLLHDSLGLGNNDCRSIITDKENKIWMGHWNGAVDRYDIETGILLHLKEKNGLVGRYIHNVMQDRNGLIWISCLGIGLDLFDPVQRKIGHLYGINEIVKSSVTCTFEDDEGRIWFGSNGGGVLRYDPFNGDINNYSLKWLATHSALFSLMEEKNGKVWVSTAGNGVRVYDPKAKTLKEIQLGTAWPNAWQADMKDDGKGTIYFCNDFYFVIHNTSKPEVVFWGIEQGLPESGVRSLAFSEDVVLLGSSNGLLKFDPDKIKFSKLSAKEDSIKGSISCLLTTRDKKTWIGTHMGSLYVYDPFLSSLTKFSKEEGFANNAINCLAEDKAGRIWAGTAGKGIKVLDLKTKTVTAIEKVNGLCESTVTSLLEKDNKMYAGTAKGLSVFDLSGEKLKLKNFGKAQGFRTSDFNSRVALLSANGNIWWGIGDMLTIYKPSNKEQITLKPSIISLDIMEKEMQFLPDTAGLALINIKDTVWSSERDTFYFRSSLEKLKKQSIMRSGIKWENVSGEYCLPTELVLPYDLDHLTFHYSGKYTTNTDKVRYRYILEGSDKEWGPVVSETKVDYRNIPPGNYVFKICSKNFSGNWSEPASFSFTVTPPWWKTTLAYSVYALLMIGTVFGYNRMRTGQLLQRQKELESVVKERTKEVVEQKNEIALQKQNVEEKQKEIVDSINYAKRIQYTLLTHEKVLKKHFSEHFILFLPKDIVSGDFYWSTKAVNNEQNELFYLAVCDSTGHGVPGAFMSLLNISFLNEAVNEKHIHEPHSILNHVRERLVNSISRDGAMDGMDGMLLCFESNSKGEIVHITYSAANNSPMLWSNGNLTELPYNKMPIGKGEKNELFELHTINAKKGDTLYLYTDGFADQFGGPKGKKFKYKQLNELLEQNSSRSLEEQKQILAETLSNWKKDFEQVDDICLIGIKV